MAAALTEARIRAAKPQHAAYKLADTRGLHLLITSAGGRLWRFRYRYAGRENTLGLGPYPEITLQEARDRREDLRRMLKHGVDPSAERKAAKAATADRAANSFEVVAREWYGKNKDAWARTHAARILRRFERDVFPWMGGIPVAAVSPPELLAVLRRIESRGRIETAHRALSNCGQVLRYAVATGRAERDPSADLRGALPPAKGEHFATTTDPARVGALLNAVDGYKATPVVRAALRLAPLVFVRPGELRHARWADIDLDAAEWRCTASKTRTDLIVPLSTQAVEILRELHPLTSGGVYVFPGARSRSRPMSDNALRAALRSVGIPRDEMSAHGFRAMARTILDEALNVRPEYIEHQLGYSVKAPDGRAYNRTGFLPERRKMMQTWADYLDGLKAGATKVIAFKRPA